MKKGKDTVWNEFARSIFLLIIPEAANVKEKDESFKAIVWP